MDYIELAGRTDLKDYSKVLERLQEGPNLVILHGLITATTELGELVDAFKKHIFYGKELDTVNMKEELGDICWGLARVLKSLGCDFDEVQLANIRKLAKRYKDGFTEQDAVVRDIVAERNQLELDLK